MKERSSEQKQGPFSRIKLFFKTRRQNEGFKKNLLTTLRDGLEGAESYNEKLSVIAQARQALLDRMLEEFKTYPKKKQKAVLLAYQEKGEKLQARFKKSGEERYRNKSQIFLRAAKMFGRSLEERNQDQTSR